MLKTLDYTRSRRTDEELQSSTAVTPFMTCSHAYIYSELRTNSRWLRTI